MFDTGQFDENVRELYVKTKSTDRRTKRTDTLLREALVALILEKRYDAITVQDILERADVGRSTFYAHYYDKDDLLESNIEWLIDLMGGPEKAHTFPGVALFRHVQEQYRLYEALASSRAAERMFHRAQMYLGAGIQAHLETAAQAPEIPIPFLANYLAGSFVVVLRWWLENKMPYSPEEMDAMFRALTMPGVQAALGNS